MSAIRFHDSHFRSSFSVRIFVKCNYVKEIAKTEQHYLLFHVHLSRTNILQFNIDEGGPSIQSGRDNITVK